MAEDGGTGGQQSVMSEPGNAGKPGNEYRHHTPRPVWRQAMAASICRASANKRGAISFSRRPGDTAKTGPLIDSASKSPLAGQSSGVAAACVARCHSPSGRRQPFVAWCACSRWKPDSASDIDSPCRASCSSRQSCSAVGDTIAATGDTVMQIAQFQQRAQQARYAPTGQPRTCRQLSVAQYRLLRRKAAQQSESTGKRCHTAGKGTLFRHAEHGAIEVASIGTQWRQRLY